MLRHRVADMIKAIKYNEAVSNGLFFQLGLTCYVIQALSKITYFGTDVVNLSFFSAPALLFCLLQEVTVNKRTRDSYVALASFALLTVIQHALGGRNLLALFALVFTARGVPIKRVLWTTLALLGISLVVTVFLAKLGIITNVCASRGAGTPLRYGLGFIGWTYSSYFVFVMASIYALLKREKARLSVLALLFAGDLWIYCQTDTRNGFFLTLFVLAALCVSKFLSQRGIELNFPQNRAVIVMVSSVFILAFLVSTALVLLYQFGGGWIEAVDRFMSFRLRYGSEALHDYGLSLFGVAVNWDQVDYVVDISYLRVTLEYGLVAALAIVALLTYTTWCFVSRGEVLPSLICVFFAVFYSFDPVMVTAFLNPLIFVGTHFASSRLSCRKTEASDLRDELCENPSRD